MPISQKRLKLWFDVEERYNATTAADGKILH